MQTTSIFNFLNSDLVSGLANASQFYNVYQSTRAGNYSEYVADLHETTQEQTLNLIEQLHLQTQEILERVLEEFKYNTEQNSIIIAQNEEIIRLLGGDTHVGAK